MSTLLRRRQMMEIQNGAGETWDIELYPDPQTGIIQGGAYPCSAGDTWYITWSPFTTGYIYDGRQVDGAMGYVNKDRTEWKAGGEMTLVITKTSNNFKIGQRQWQNTNECNAAFIKIRITPA